MTSNKELEETLAGAGLVIGALLKRFAPDGLYLTIEEIEDAPELEITEDFVQDRIHLELA